VTSKGKELGHVQIDSREREGGGCLERVAGIGVEKVGRGETQSGRGPSVWKATGDQTE